MHPPARNKLEVVHLDGDTSNQLITELERWYTVLKHREDVEPPVPPCP